MNKYLTLEEKQSLVNMLQKHYTIEEGLFISNLAEDDEEKVELTLKAFSLAKEPKDDVKHCINIQTDPLSGKTTVSGAKFVTVQIDKLSSKLILVKAVKETTGWGLKESKDFVDTIVLFERIPETGSHAYVYKPFKVGPYERITVDQWKAIANSIPDDNFIKWHFV